MIDMKNDRRKRIGTRPITIIHVNVRASSKVHSTSSMDQVTENHVSQTIKQTEKKRSRRRRRIIAFYFVLLLLLLLLIILTFLLLLILIKPKRISSSKIESILRWNRTGITVAGITNTSGNSSSHLNTPHDLVFDYANNLYIADTHNERIQRFLVNEYTAVTLAGNGTEGTSPYQFYRPFDIVLDSNENFYVSDGFNNRLQFFHKGVLSGTTVLGIGNGTAGSASDQLNNPYGLALDHTTGILYVADANNHRIMSYKHNSNNKNGTLVFGSSGGCTNNTQLKMPLAMYLDLFSNSLVIANLGCHNIVRYEFNAATWSLVAGNITGSSGSDSTHFNQIVDMTFDPMGNMYVCDRLNHRIQFFYPNQKNGSTIAGITGVLDSNATTFNWPYAVRLDTQLNMYVVDARNHRIQKFLRY